MHFFLLMPFATCLCRKPGGMVEQPADPWTDREATWIDGQHGGFWDAENKPTPLHLQDSDCSYPAAEAFVVGPPWRSFVASSSCWSRCQNHTNTQTVPQSSVEVVEVSPPKNPQCTLFIIFLDSRSRSLIRQFLYPRFTIERKKHASFRISLWQWLTIVRINGEFILLWNQKHEWHLSTNFLCKTSCPIGLRSRWTPRWWWHVSSRSEETTATGSSRTIGTMVAFGTKPFLGKRKDVGWVEIQIQEIFNVDTLRKDFGCDSELIPMIFDYDYELYIYIL